MNSAAGKLLCLLHDAITVLRMVKTLNGRIYVTDMNGNLLCRVKADISEFPESDAEILRAGMKVTGRELKEIVAYLES